VALAAIQGLSAKLDDAHGEIADAREELDEKAERIADLEAENEHLRERLAALEEHLGLNSGASPGVADD
jgi:regulator of replication initiation timing